MTLSELIDNVYTLTKRPDRAAETLLAVKNATLKVHTSDYYYRDLFETGLDFGAAQYVQDFDFKAGIPRWRAFKYLRVFDYTNSTPGRFITLIPPELVLDRYKVQKSDICYAAGAYIHINCETQERYYLHGCYLFPDITDSGFSSWIADDFPFAIIHLAASSVLSAIGRTEDAKAFRATAMEEMTKIAISNVVAGGF